MNEKMFIVTPESKLHEEYTNHLQVRERVTELAKDFLKEQGIETMTYGMSPDGTLWIEPTPADAEKFKFPLSKSRQHDGLIPFKNTAKVNKEWKKLMIEHNIQPRDFSQPTIAMYFRSTYGRYRSRIFFGVDDLLYLQFGTLAEIDTPDGMTEIKGSAFYAALEAIMEKRKTEGTLDE